VQPHSVVEQNINYFDALLHLFKVHIELLSKRKPRIRRGFWFTRPCSRTERVQCFR
jgi:hypothetical protein